MVLPGRVFWDPVRLLLAPACRPGLLYPPHPLPKVCSLVEVDAGLLQLVNTSAGNGGVQAAQPAAQHGFHDLHEARGFGLIIHHTNLSTTSTLPVLEAAGQGQGLPERTWQSGLPGTPLTPQTASQDLPVTAPLPEAGGGWPLLLASRATASAGSGLRPHRVVAFQVWSQEPGRRMGPSRTTRLPTSCTLSSQGRH